MNGNDRYIEDILRDIYFDAPDDNHRYALKSELLRTFPKYRLRPMVHTKTVFGITVNKLAIRKTIILIRRIAAVILLIISVAAIVHIQTLRQRSEKLKDVSHFRHVLAGDDQLGNDIMTLDAGFWDVDPSGFDYTVTINWGDGLVEPGEIYYLDIGQGRVDGVHEYGDNIETTVYLGVYSGIGAYNFDVFSMQILNVSPTVDVGPDLTVDVGQAVNFSASFIDLGWEDDFTGYWNFGDGSGNVIASLTYENNYPDFTGTAQDMYSFLNPETYNVTLDIYDDDVGIGTESMLYNVVPVPGAVLLGMLGLSVAGLKLRKRKEL